MARASLVPVALPAVPASDLHAATRSYADGLNPEDLVGADDVFAYYKSTSTQSCSSGTDTWVAYGTAVESHSLVTQGTLSPGHKFTLGATGVWAITLTARFASATGGERYFGLWSDRFGSDAVLQAWGGYGGAAVTTMMVGYVGIFASGDYVAGRVYHNQGASVNLAATGRWIQIALIRKYT